MSPVHDIAEPLAAHARRDDLGRLVRTAAFSAADERRTRLTDGLDELVGELGLDEEARHAAGVDVVEALRELPAPKRRAAAVLGWLLAWGVGLADTSDEARGRASENLAWLAAHTPLDGLSRIDEALSPEQAAPLWEALRGYVARETARGPRLAAAAALLASSSADDGLDAIFIATGDPLVAALRSRGGSAPGSEAVPGTVVPAPSGPVATFLWCVTGAILLRYLGRFVARVLLRSRRPGALEVTEDGVVVSERHELLGRKVSERKRTIPRDALARAEREVRYPRLGLYAGLLMLGIGTFVGASLFADGARAGSPSFIGVGALIFAVGVILDLAIGQLWPGRRGTYRIVLVPRKGRSLAIQVADASAADRALMLLRRPPATVADA